MKYSKPHLWHIGFFNNKKMTLSIYILKWPGPLLGLGYLMLITYSFMLLEISSYRIYLQNEVCNSLITYTVWNHRFLTSYILGLLYIHPDPQ